MENGYTLFLVGSGSYRFNVSAKGLNANAGQNEPFQSDLSF